MSAMTATQIAYAAEIPAVTDDDRLTGRDHHDVLPLVAEVALALQIGLSHNSTLTSLIPVESSAPVRVG
jgi:hypothetical protein